MQTKIEDFVFPEPYQDLKESLAKFHDGKMDITTVYNKFVYARLSSRELEDAYKSVLGLTYDKTYISLEDSDDRIQINRGDMYESFNQKIFDAYPKVDTFILMAYDLLWKSMIGEQKSMADYKKNNSIKETKAKIHQIMYDRIKKVSAETKLANDNVSETSRLFYQLLDALKLPLVGVVDKSYFEAFSTLEDKQIQMAIESNVIRPYIYNQFMNDNHAQTKQRVQESTDTDAMEMLETYYHEHANNFVTSFRLSGLMELTKFQLQCAEDNILDAIKLSLK